MKQVNAHSFTVVLFFFLWRLEKALKGELFSKQDLSQIESFMRVAIAEAKEAQVHSKENTVCYAPLLYYGLLIFFLLNPGIKT